MSASAHRRVHDPRYLQLHVPGNGHVQDVSGWGRHGTWAGTVGYTPGPFNGHQVMRPNKVGDVGLPASFLTAIANDTVGTIAGYIFLDADDNATSNILTVSNNASATRTELLFGANQESGNENFTFNLLADGVHTTYWYKTGFVPAVWNHLAIVQDAVSPVMYINGAPAAATGATGTGWMKALLTDATTKATKATVGAVYRNSGGTLIRMDGNLAHVRYYNIALTGDEVAALYEYDMR